MRAENRVEWFSKSVIVARRRRRLASIRLDEERPRKPVPKVGGIAGVDRRSVRLVAGSIVGLAPSGCGEGEKGDGLDGNGVFVHRKPPYGLPMFGQTRALGYSNRPIEETKSMPEEAASSGTLTRDAWREVGIAVRMPLENER